MKKFLLTFVCLLAAAHLFAQKLEVTAGVYSGLFRYSGSSAEPVSFINASSPNLSGFDYTNNPYGNKAGVGFGLSGQAQLVSKGGFILGLQAAYEQLKSKISINQVYVSNPILSSPNGAALSATGRTYLKNSTINLNPYLGYRIPFAGINMDVLGGMDFGLITNNRESGEARASDGQTYTTSIDRKNAKKDVRLRFGLAASLNRFGVTASYAHGLTNYMEGYIGGGKHEANSEVIRLGLSYRLF